jgi:hypothetical protein
LPERHHAVVGSYVEGATVPGERGSVVEANSIDETA